MTYDQYWNGDVWMVGAFRKADRERQKRKNFDAWLQGMYVYDGVSVALANAFRKKGSQPVNFPKEPYSLYADKPTEDEQADREEQERLRAKLYMNNMVRAGRNWGK